MNEAVQRAREVALSILQPTQRDIDHGMELHEGSIVIESYGFSPRSAVDGDALKAAVDEGASEAEIADMREDMGMTRCATDPLEREEYMAAWEAAGVTCILQNAGEEGQSVWRLIKRLARFTYVTDMLRDFVRRAVTPDDIVAAKEHGRHCLYMMCNGVP
ncbi:MAG: dipeptidase, partial [Armatimonadota bacterium]